jgi:hypothetical protein
MMFLSVPNKAVNPSNSKGYGLFLCLIVPTMAYCIQG